MRPETLGIIGLGAVGGSLARAAAAAGIPRIVGYASPPKDGLAAVRAGALTELATSARNVFRQADLTVLATPPAATLALLHRSAPLLEGRSGTFVTDVTSVKRPVTALAQRLGLGGRFAGSHPHVSASPQGFAAARPELLRGAVVYVTPATSDDLGAAREVADFWAQVIEAEPVIVAAAEHDATIAWTSHLAQASAVALAGALARHGPRGVSYGATSREATALAAASTESWRDVLLLNRDAVLETLDGLDERLDALRQALRAGDVAALSQWFEDGARWRRMLAP